MRLCEPDRRASLLLAVAALALLLVALSACGKRGESSAQAACATKQLYGKTLEVRVVGKQVPCSQVRRIVRGPCRDGRTWSCFSNPPPGPVLYWFRERERFRPRYSTTIEARRYPCSEASVTARAWVEARRQAGDPFPTQQQVLADDLVRCGLLKGMSYKKVRALLGRPDGVSSEKGTLYADYDVGPERDSFFQVDAEVFSVEFGRDRIFRSARFYQS